MLKTIITASRLILCHSNDLMDYNILEHSVLIPCLEMCSIEKVILDVLAIAQIDLSSNNTINYNISRLQNYKVKFDRRRLQQVLLNMLLNAIKFTKNGAITVEVKIIQSFGNKNDKYIQMSVKDEGIGISHHDLPHIFTPFFQSNEE